MIKTVRDAAEAVGRDPDSITFCVAAPMYIGDGSTEPAAAHARPVPLVRRHGRQPRRRHRRRSTADGSAAPCPQALTDYIAGRKGYDYNSHGKAGNDHVDFVPDEIVDRFCLLGTADEHIAKLEELKAIGVDQFAGYLQHDNKEETLRVYGETVIPALSDHLTAKA